jgi:hypothetical protein
MESPTKLIVQCVLFSLPGIIVGIHIGYFRPALELAYVGEADTFMQWIIDYVYPRFEVERHRFGLSFFLNKIDQVLFRTILLYLSGLSVVMLYSQYPKIKDFIQRHSTAPATHASIHVLRIIFFTYFLYLLAVLSQELFLLQSAKAFYKPILLLRIFSIPYPSTIGIISLTAGMYLLTLLTLFNIRPVLCTLLNLLLFVLVQSWIFSFEKVDHGFATYTYVFMLLPFLWNEQQNNAPVFASWSLQRIRIVIAAVYLLSSLEKLLISAFSWMNAENMKGYLFLHETTLSKIIVQSDVLCIAIGLFTLVLQLSFVLIVFLPQYKWWWIGGGILFHTGTLLVMEIGHPLNPWLLVYVFYFDWTPVYNYFVSLQKRFALK